MLELAERSSDARIPRKSNLTYKNQNTVFKNPTVQNLRFKSFDLETNANAFYAFKYTCEHFQIMKIMHGTHALQGGYKLVYALIPCSEQSILIRIIQHILCLCYLHKNHMVRTSCRVKEPITDSSLNQHLNPY